MSKGIMDSKFMYNESKQDFDVENGKINYWYVLYNWNIWKYLGKWNVEFKDPMTRYEWKFC